MSHKQINQISRNSNNSPVLSSSDEEVNFSIQKGLDASRSTVVYFKHNDMEDLEQKLIAQAMLERKNPRKAAKTRKFLITEAVYMNTGEMAPLRELVLLRQKYQLRYFLDESVAFGVLGETGRGLVEHLGVDVSDGRDQSPCWRRWN